MTEEKSPVDTAYDKIMAITGLDVLHRPTDKGAIRDALNELYDKAQEITGDSVTEGAGPDATCGCGEAITYYSGEWYHLFNDELRGTDDHDAEPDEDVELPEEEE